MTAVIIALLLALASYFIFRKKPANGNATAGAATVSYAPLLSQHVDYYQKRDDAGKARFETLVNKFLDDVRIEGVGTEITDLDCVLIASSAVIPVFGFPEWRYQKAYITATVS
ncbi:MAG: hypothetical protein EOO04_11320 [Chitinophagaceae bacterium]|nr:MAG: hypothetical protein EOO04_11320 [Chitinophagaceae bacterium]